MTARKYNRKLLDFYQEISKLILDYFYLLSTLFFNFIYAYQNKIYFRLFLSLIHFVF